MPDVSTLRLQCFALLIPVILLCSLTIAHAAIDCYQCHGSNFPPDYRPVDAPYRNITSGGFQGNHRTHMGPGTDTTTCTACHPSSGYTSSHRNGRIDLAANINASPLTAVYRNGSSGFSQTPAPRLGTCSNVNCHFEKESPIWGKEKLGAPDGCTACHGAPPNGGESGAPGSHARHAAVSTGMNGCSVCHSDHLAETNPFAHATSAGRRPLSIRLTSGQGTYDGPVNDYLPKSQGNQFGRCSNVYCHTNGTSVATGAGFANVTTPVWGTSNALACGSCHGNPPAYAKGEPKANAHLRHNWYGYSCSRCHYATTRDGTSISNYSSSHGNRSYDVAPPPGESLDYSYSPSGGNCTTSYCHSSAQGTGDPTGPPTYVPVAWNNSLTDACDKCHRAGFHPINDWIVLKSGSHQKHLEFGTSEACNSCHYHPRYAGRVCDQCHYGDDGGYLFDHADQSPRGPEHANGAIDVAISPDFPSPGATGSYSGDSVPRTPYGSCTNLYCHSQGTRATAPFEAANIPVVQWGGGAMPADCTGCHNGDRNSSLPISTGSHSRHLRYDCPSCHAASVYSSRSAIPYGGPMYGPVLSRHSNGTVEVSFNNASTAMNGGYAGQSPLSGKKAGTPAGRCTSTYCHSNGVRVVTGALFGNNSSPAWGSTGISCGSCHGYPPGYADTLPKANAHQTHAANPCSTCHFSVTADGIAITDASLHPNNSYELAPGPGTGFTYSYSKLGGSCADVSCHPGGSPPRAWTSTPCGTCHGAPPADSAHKTHFTGLPRMAVYGNSSTTAQYLYNCGVCHPVDAGRDNDGSKQVELFNPAVPPSSLKAESTAADYAGGTCTNVYCHSNGSSVATAQAPTSPPLAWNAPARGCDSCHGNPPAYGTGSPKANSHAAHGGYSCSKCHATTTTDGTTIADKPRHINASYDLSPGINTTFSYTFAQTGGSCSANSCHSDGTYSRIRVLNAPLPSTWGGESLTCSGCHDNPPQYASSGSRTNSHPVHAKYPCGSCHYQVAGDGSGISNRALHADGTCDLTPSPGVSFTSHWVVTSYYWDYVSTECDNISCHHDGTAVATGTRVLNPSATNWWGGGLGCTGCHANPPAYASGSPKANSHTRHSSTGCQTCHYTVTTSGTAITDRNLHANDSYDVQPAPSVTFGYSFAASGGSCANVSCHNDGTGVATGIQQIAPPAAWGDSFTCGSCHGNPPSYAGNSPKKNSHLGSHTGIGCQLCHAAVTTTGTTITTPSLHGNSQYNVTPGTGTGFSYTYAASGGSCANIACHSDGTAIRTGTMRSNSIAWGGASLGCSGCHGNPPAYASNSPKGNAHLMTGHNALGCRYCHYPVTGNGTGIADPGRHKNGAYDVGPDPSVSFTYTYSSTSYGVCRNVTCHSDGTAVVTGIPQSTAFSYWSAGTACTFCHATPPNYESGTPKRNSHAKHQSAGNGCKDCHYDTITSAGMVISNPALHKDGVYTLRQGPGRSFSYSFSTDGGTCSLVSCHGDGTSIATGTLVSPTPAQWGVTSLGCDGCHGYPPAYPSGYPKKNGHPDHPYGCQLCHSSTTWNGTYVSSSYHINGQYTLSGTKTGTYSYSASGSTCSLVQCHSDGTNVSTGSISNGLGTTAWGGTLTLSCTSCHGMPPSYSNGYPKGNSHGLHAGLSIGCVSCHAGVTSDGATILNRSKHGDGQYDVAFSNSTTSFTYTFRSGGSSCANVACHPEGKKTINWSIFAQVPSSFSPLNNENYAPVNEPVEVRFTEDMDPASITAEGVFTLTNGTTTVPGTVSYDPATRTASFTPVTTLDYSNPYTARLTNAVRNLAGQQLQNSYTWNFTTTNSPNYTYFVQSDFNLMSMGYLDSQSFGGGGYWSVITPGWNGSALSGMNQGYAKIDEATKVDAQLRTWQLDLTNYQSLKLSFYYNVKMSPPSVAELDISFNGSEGPWTNLWRISAPYANYSYQGSHSMNLSTMAKGRPNIMIRFRFTPQTPSNNGWWAVDNVFISGDPR